MQERLVALLGETQMEKGETQLEKLTPQQVIGLCDEEALRMIFEYFNGKSQESRIITLAYALANSIVVAGGTESNALINLRSSSKLIKELIPKLLRERQEM